MSTETMVCLKDVIKHFGTITALRGIDLELKRGCCLGIFGPNGAGKTTLLRILATLARPSAGTVRIAGYDAVKEAEKVRPLRRVESSNLPIRLSDSVRKLAILRTYVWT